MAREVAKGFGAARAGGSPGHSPPQGDVCALSTTCERGARSEPELVGRQGTGALPLAAAGLTTRFERSGHPNGRAEFVTACRGHGVKNPLFFACQPTSVYGSVTALASFRRLFYVACERLPCPLQV